MCNKRAQSLTVVVSIFGSDFLSFKLIPFQQNDFHFMMPCSSGVLALHMLTAGKEKEKNSVWKNLKR